MLDDNTEKRIQVRVTWALEDELAATKKIYHLVSELPGTENLKDEYPQWREITQHLADCESHLKNALRYFPQEDANQ